MIITCRNCEAQFEFDELRVPEEGVQVRCSSCQAVFSVASESQSPEAFDLTEAGPEPGGEERGDRGDPVPADAFGSIEDFAFDASPLAESEEAAPALEFDDSDEILEATPLAEDDFSDLGASPDAADEDPGRLGEVGRTSLDLEAENSAPEIAGEVPEKAGSRDQRDESPGVVSESKVAIGAIALASVPAGSHRGDAAVEPRSPGFRKRFRAMGRGLGWGLTAVLVVLALLSVFQETTDSMRTTEQSIEVGRLLAEGLKGEWVDTMAGRTLLAVTGELHNPTSSAENLGAILEVSLVGPDGRRLVWPSAPMGVRLTESEIRELPLAGLKSAQGRAARALALTVLPPGQSVAIQAIFPRPPDDAVHFALDLGPAVDRSLENERDSGR